MASLEVLESSSSPRDSSIAYNFSQHVKAEYLTYLQEGWLILLVVGWGFKKEILEHAGGNGLVRQ